MKNFSAYLDFNSSFNYSNLTMLDKCPSCDCGVLASVFEFGLINLILIACAYCLFNKAYTERYTFKDFNDISMEDKFFYIIDKILMALFLINLASVFYALTLPLISSL